MHTTRESAIKFLKDRLRDLGLTPRAVSLSLDKSPTYLADYMGDKASPKALPEDVRLDLARILDTDQDNLRYQRISVKDSATKIPQDVSSGGNGRPPVRRATDMSMGDIYTRLGKLEQRIEQLETERPVASDTKGKKHTRP
jgi:hypothetical protein